MNSKRIIAFASVVIFSILAALFIQAAMTPTLKEEKTTATLTTEIVATEVLQVLIAKRDLPAGSFIDRGDVAWAKKSVVGNTWIQSNQFDLDDFDGAVLFKDSKAGEAIAYGNIVRPRQQGFLAAVLAPGKRAISIPVNEITANAGLIGPGDFVDVLLTFYADSDRGARSMQRGRDITMLTSKTLASAIRVIAINRHSVADAKKEIDELLTTATLEVDPTLAQHLTLATHMGELALSLRSKHDAKNDLTTTEAWSSDVHSAGNQLKPEPGLVLMRGNVTQVVGYPQQDKNTQEQEEKE